MSRKTTRHAAVGHTVDKIRKIETDRGVTRESLAAFKLELIELSNKRELFTVADFAPTAPSDAAASCLYRLAEDADHRFALYLNVARGDVDSPAHDHTTWAVVVGIDGDEVNHFYRRSAQGVAQIRTEVVSPGTGVTMLPDDLHSIHIHASTPVINFHMYGLALEQLHHRRYFDTRNGVWKSFPAHRDIREAREQHPQA